jgi:multiple sugar transport system substrate-binding protein
MYTNSGQKWHDHFKLLEAAFEKQNPGIDIELIIGDGPKFDTMRLGGLPPDIIDLPDYAHLGPLGELVDIMPLIQRDGLTKQINPAVLKSLTTPNGAVYSVPLQLAINTSYFNRDFFQQGGLTAPDRLGDQWNWDAVYQSAKKLTRDQNGDGTPESFGIDRPWGATWRVLTFQAGGSFYEWDKMLQPVKSLWTSEPVVRAIEFNERFYRERLTPHFHPGVDQAQYYFWTGKTAINLNDGIAIVGSYLKDATFDWDISLMPRGSAGPVTMFNGSGPHILTSTKHLNEAWQWMKFVAFNQDNVDQMVKSLGVIPAISSALSAYPAVAGISHKNYQALLQQTLYPQPYTQWPVPLEINPRKIDMNPVWEGKVAARTHLQNIHEKMQNIIDQKLAAAKK